jgi:hypothetical protein
MQSARHLTIQGLAFVVLLIIAVVCGAKGAWVLTGVFVLLALFPGMMVLALIRKLRTVNGRTKGATERQS